MLRCTQLFFVSFGVSLTPRSNNKVQVNHCVMDCLEPGAKMANAPKWAIWGEGHVFPTKQDPVNTKTLTFWFRAPPLFRVLKRKLGPGRAGRFPLPPSRETTYWCMVVRDCNAYRNLRNGIQKGAAWSELLANVRAEPK